MLNKAKYILYLVILVVWARGSTGETIEIQLRSKKDVYICGEPVLLKTTVMNTSSKVFVGNTPSYGWGLSGFMLYISCGDDDFADILHIRRRKPTLYVATVPRQFDRFYDRYRLPNTLLSNQQVERLDMLIFPKYGDYKLKAVLSDRDGKVGESEPIQIRLLTPQEKYDSILQLGDPNFLINLGSSIFYAHHMEQLCGGYPPGESLVSREFEKVAPVIIAKHKNSVFREYVMYADIMAHGRNEHPLHPMPISYKELAESFIKEYPKSWLLPEIYRRLFWTYVEGKDIAKAEQIRDLALQKAPYAVVLRHVKKKDLSKLDKKK
jgi:hypothetical protein